MADKYLLTKDFRGYAARGDITSLGDGYLVSGSQNVLIRDDGTVGAREGFTLYGATNAALTPITASYEWTTHRGNEIPIRAYQAELEFYFSGAWRRLENGWGTSTSFQFTEYWDTTEVQDLLLFVNGSSNVYSWSGGITTFASATGNTITKEGTTTWGEEGFLTAGTRRVIIGGTAHTYTGGEGTTTLTGVTPDPTLGGYAAGDVIHQQIRTTANSAISGLPSTLADSLIATLNNQVYYGSLVNRLVYVSKQNNFADVTFATPRVAGEGAVFTLDGTPTGFAAHEDAMYISVGTDFWYQTIFQASSDLTKESLGIKRLNTAPNDAAQAQELITKIKNDIIYVSNEPAFNSLGRVRNVETPQTTSLSDIIKNDFSGYDFTNGHVKFHRDRIYIAAPVENLVLIYNIVKKYWEAPQIIPVRRLAIIDGDIYGHSSMVPETYKLFDGTNDNNFSFLARAVFSYQSFGDRVNLKNFDEIFTEGYITSNTDITMKVNYDFMGSEQILETVIFGNDEDIIFGQGVSSGIGDDSLGDLPLGGEAGDESEQPPKFRHIACFPKTNIYEVQISYETDAIDQVWRLLTFGANVRLAGARQVSIKK